MSSLRIDIMAFIGLLGDITMAWAEKLAASLSTSAVLLSGVMGPDGDLLNVMRTEELVDSPGRRAS